ncbi:MAG TPA: hypothetical protein VFJ16_07385 [Longimicrobium sp.]|nr:hypothetical protein [Longimicrobium sp.]
MPVVEATACKYGGEYPHCTAAPGDPDTPMPEGAGPSGGGTSPPPPPPPDSTTACDPVNDPNCEQPLTSADSTTILAAIRDYVRPDTAIADTAHRRKCKQMRDQFMQSFNAKTVFRGGSDLTGTASHYGATYDSRIHFDPWLLGGAASGNVSDLRELANTALHEAAHVLLFEHPNGETNGIYTDEPFNLLPPGAGVCIK